MKHNIKNGTLTNAKYNIVKFLTLEFLLSKMKVSLYLFLISFLFTFNTGVATRVHSYLRTNNSERELKNAKNNKKGINTGIMDGRMMTNKNAKLPKTNKKNDKQECEATQ